MQMRNNVYVEYQKTVHFKNASGVRAECANCHVPKEWLDKVVRKIRATTSFHKVVGTIDTPEKFEHKRIELAERVWASMKESNSRECRNCHSFDTIGLYKQRPASAAAMAPVAAARGVTCIDCHKGIAHKMPDLAARARNQAETFMSRTEKLDGKSLLTKRGTSIYEPDKAADKIATVLPGVPVAKLERKGDFVKITWIAGRRGGRPATATAAGDGILNMSIAAGAVDKVSLGEKRFYPEANQDWTQSSLVGWLPVRRHPGRGDAVADRRGELLQPVRYLPRGETGGIPRCRSLAGRNEEPISHAPA